MSAAPVSAAPVPVSAEPVSSAPVSAAPGSAEPVSSAPVSSAPVSSAPAEPVSSVLVSAEPAVVIDEARTEVTEAIAIQPADAIVVEPTEQLPATRRTEQTTKLAYAALSAPADRYGQSTWQEPPAQQVEPAVGLPIGEDEETRKDRRRRRRHLEDRRRTSGRRPLIGLVALVLLTLAGAFLGGVSADPFWLSIGKGSVGTVAVGSCVTRGAGTTCVGSFRAPAFSAREVTVAGLPPALRKGTQSARMLSAKHGWAYAGSDRALQLRWGLGLLVTLLLGLLAAWATGAKYLRPFGRGKVFLARVLAFGGPVIAFLAVVFVAIA